MSQMRVSVEITSSLGRRLNVVVPVEEVEKARKERIQQLTKTIKMDGFRPGKIPAKVIEERYGDSVMGEVVEKIIRSTLPDALKQEKLRPAVYPAIESLKAEKGSALEYIAAFDVMPEIKVNDLSNVTLEKLIVAIKDTDIDRVLEQMRKQHALWHDVQRAAQWGDRITFDLQADEGKQDQKGLQLVLEEGKLPAGFEVLVGKNNGATFKVPLPGRDDEAVVTVQSIAEPKLPQLDADFAKKLGIEEGTIEALREQVRKHMQDELDRALHNKLKGQIIEKLVETHTFELPKGMIEEEKQHMEREFRAQISRQIGKEYTDALPENSTQEMETNARKRVILGLLFPEIVKKYNITVDENRVNKHIDRVAEAFQGAQQMIDMIHKDKEMMNNIRSQVLEEQVIDKLLEQVKFNEKTAEYSDVMHFADTHHGHAHQHDDHVHDENCNHSH